MDEKKVFPAKIQIHQGRDAAARAIQFSPATGEVSEEKDRKFILNVACCSKQLPGGSNKFDWSKAVNFGMNLSEVLVFFAAVKSLCTSDTCKDGKQSFVHGSKSLNVEKGTDGKSIKIGFYDKVNGNGSVMVGVGDANYYALLYILEYTIMKAPSIMAWGESFMVRPTVIDMFSKKEEK